MRLYAIAPLFVASSFAAEPVKLAPPRLSLPALAAAPEINGVIHEDEWTGAARFPGLMSWNRDVLAERSGCVWLGWDETSVFVAVMSELPPAGKLAAEASDSNRSAIYLKDDAIEIWLTDFQTRYSEGHILSETIGIHTGCVPLALAGAQGVHKRQVGVEEYTRIARTQFATLFPYEVRSMGYTRELAKARDALFTFGYGEPDCEVIRTWDEPKPVRVVGPDSKLLILKRPGKAPDRGLRLRWRRRTGAGPRSQRAEAAAGLHCA